MLRSRIIPSLLIRDGGLVKGKRFTDYKYVGDPLNAVKIYNEKEVDELVVYDIGASVEKLSPDFEFLKNLARQSRMPLCYGGGIKDADTAAKIISLGFEKISLSSVFFERDGIVQETAAAIGTQSVVVTLDVRKSKIRGNYVAWSHNGKKRQKGNILELCEKAESDGAGELVVNSIEREGSMEGYDLELARSIRAVTSVPLTFLGGAGTIDHMKDLINEVGTTGAAAGSMFVFNGRFRAVLISYSNDV